jgi:methylmalonyl-CoA mutase C-terminal domain/subunit
MTENIRVLLTKVGLDSHDRGIKLVASRFREEGMEVIYTGPWQSKEAVVEIALEEDVDVVGFNVFSDDHLLVPKVLDLMTEEGILENITVVVGGNVPEQHRDTLYDAGVDGIFLPGSDLDDIVDFVEENVP